MILANTIYALTHAIDGLEVAQNALSVSSHNAEDCYVALGAEIERLHTVLDNLNSLYHD